jgi:hypothetical protein
LRPGREPALLEQIDQSIVQRVAEARSQRLTAEDGQDRTFDAIQSSAMAQSDIRLHRGCSTDTGAARGDCTARPRLDGAGRSGAPVFPKSPRRSVQRCTTLRGQGRHEETILQRTQSVHASQKFCKQEAAHSSGSLPTAGGWGVECLGRAGRADEVAANAARRKPPAPPPGSATAARHVISDAHSRHARRTRGCREPCS